MDQTTLTNQGPFFGTTENAVKSQIWIAVSVYVLVAIIKKCLQLSASLYEILQILSLTMFERMPINQLLSLQPQASEENNVGTLVLLDICASAKEPLRIREIPYEFRKRLAGESKLDASSRGST